MTPTQEAAMRQALEFCEFLWREVVLNDWAEGQREATEAALRAALAEPTVKDSLQVEQAIAETATTQQQVEQTPPSEYRRGYWDGFNIGKREGRIEAEDALAEPVQEPVAWTDADADAARLAMELEALLLSCKDTAAVSRWWDSAHDALELHRQRLSMERLANQQKTTGSPCPTCEALARAVMMDQTGAA